MGPSSSSTEHLVFSCPAGWFAVPASVSAEIVQLPELVRVPGAPEHMRGIFHFRGEVIPLIDLSHLCGVHAAPGRRALLVRSGRGAMALPTETVLGLQELQGELKPMAESGFRAHLRGPAQVEDRSVMVVEPTGFLEFLGSPAEAS